MLGAIAGAILLTGIISPAEAAVTPGGVAPAAMVAAPTVPQACPRRDVVEQVRTDRHRYRVGQLVKITVVALNRSQHDCVLPSIVSVTVRDASGAIVFEQAVGIAWIPEARWRRGEAVTWGFAWQTNGAVPGRYTATGRWDSYQPASTSFTIGGSA
jgi:hypothetical protein